MNRYFEIYQENFMHVEVEIKIFSFDELPYKLKASWQEEIIIIKTERESKITCHVWRNVWPNRRNKSFSMGKVIKAYLFNLKFDQKIETFFAETLSEDRNHFYS